MGRAPNEMPGRPVSEVVPMWSDNERPGEEAARRRAAVEWRRDRPRIGWWRRLRRHRSGA